MLSVKPKTVAKDFISLFFDYVILILGACLGAAVITLVLMPHRLIDGGTVGLAMILTHIFGDAYLPFFLLITTGPFAIIAWKYIGWDFVVRMAIALMSFIAASQLLPMWIAPIEIGDMEVVIFGGICLGASSGLVLRHGASMDGTEITAILINRLTGMTVGQVVLYCNIVIFTIAGLIYQDWTTALRSLLVYVVAYKVIDAVLVGFDEMKSLMVISEKPEEITHALLKNNFGVTVLYGRGAYHKQDREVLYVVVERLQLREVRLIIQTIDPKVLIMIENLHEMVTP